MWEPAGFYWIFLHIFTPLNVIMVYHLPHFATTLIPVCNKKQNSKYIKITFFLKMYRSALFNCFNDTIQKSEEKLSDRIICYPQTVPHTTVFFFYLTLVILAPKVIYFGKLHWECYLHLYSKVHFLEIVLHGLWWCFEVPKESEELSLFFLFRNKEKSLD